MPVWRLMGLGTRSVLVRRLGGDGWLQPDGVVGKGWGFVCKAASGCLTVVIYNDRVFQRLAKGIYLYIDKING